MNNLCEKKKPYDRNLELLRKYREGDKESGEALAILNSPLVYSIASRFSGRGADMSDLVESGNIGLVKAIKTFDFAHGTAFSTYAVPLIFGEIRRFLRDDGLIKVSREESGFPRYWHLKEKDGFHSGRTRAFPHWQSR